MGKSLRNLQVVVLAACTPMLDVPPGSAITCATSADCPSGLTCAVQIGRCVDPETEDRVVPEITQIAIGAAVLGNGDSTTVVFSTSEPLALVPEIELRAAAATHALVAAQTEAG